jgi:thiamine biosynthesis lipoprotein
MNDYHPVNEGMTMNDSQFSGRLDAPIARRDLIARLGAVALAYTGLAAFRPFAPSRLALSTAPKWDDNFELAVDLEIAAQEGFRYHRPYVAVWIEDAAGRPVRTLSLWVNTNGRGPRYIRELKSWVRAERDQQAAGGPDLVATVSSATRLPGHYSVTWDGRDENRKPVDQGTYRVFIEAAREHGTYQMMQHDMTFGAKPVAADLGGNVEIKGARLDYRRRK